MPTRPAIAIDIRNNTQHIPQFMPMEFYPHPRVTRKVFQVEERYRPLVSTDLNPWQDSPPQRGGVQRISSDHRPFSKRLAESDDGLASDCNPGLPLAWRGRHLGDLIHDPWIRSLSCFTQVVAAVAVRILKRIQRIQGIENVRIQQLIDIQ